jgi:hypothetical protein
VSNSRKSFKKEETFIDRSRKMESNHLKALVKLMDEPYMVDSDPNQLEACKEFSIPMDHLSIHYQDFLDKVDGVDIVTPADSNLTI